MPVRIEFFTPWANSTIKLHVFKFPPSESSKSNLIGAHRGAHAEGSLSEMATFDCSFRILNRTIHVLDPDHVVILRDSLRQTFGRLVLGELEQAMFPG